MNVLYSMEAVQVPGSMVAKRTEGDKGPTWPDEQAWSASGRFLFIHARYWSPKGRTWGFVDVLSKRFEMCLNPLPISDPRVDSDIPVDRTLLHLKF